MLDIMVKYEWVVGTERNHYSCKYSFSFYGFVSTFKCVFMYYLYILHSLVLFIRPFSFDFYFLNEKFCAKEYWITIPVSNSSDAFSLASQNCSTFFVLFLFL